jgi:acyl phosphate:glycerol-3-phosphate acyltransferase
MSLIVAVVIAYIAGSIPAAYLAGRARGIDLRKHGSGNLGATNVFRVLGARTGILVFAFDMAKGALPVLLLPGLVASRGTVGGPGGGNVAVVTAILCGVAAIAGHVRPVFLRFGKGGKGVATAAGVFVALAPAATLLALAVFIATVLASGYVSLASLVAAATLPVLLAILAGPMAPLTLVSIVIATFVIWMHRANIGRLRRGEEHRFGKVGTRGGGLLVGATVIGAVAMAVLVAAGVR